METTQLGRQFPLVAIQRGDRVRLRYCGYNVALRYGDTWGTVTRDCVRRGGNAYRSMGTKTTMITVALDEIEGDERRVKLAEIGVVERDGELIAKRVQAPASAADQFPLVYTS